MYKNILYGQTVIRMLNYLNFTKSFVWAIKFICEHAGHFQTVTTSQSELAICWCWLYGNNSRHTKPKNDNIQWSPLENERALWQIGPWIQFKHRKTGSLQTVSSSDKVNTLLQTKSAIMHKSAIRYSFRVDNQPAVLKGRWISSVHKPDCSLPYLSIHIRYCIFCVHSHTHTACIVR